MRKRQSRKNKDYPKKGHTFISWAIYNCGICIQKSFRTRKEAIGYCLKTRQTRDRDIGWKEMFKYMRVVKVKCTVV